MKDVEFISELYIVIVDGLQDQQKTIDKFYADYDVVYPKKSKHLSNFNQVIESLRTIEDVIVETRFSKKADFYALFAAVKELNLNSDHRVDLSFAANRSVNFLHNLRNHQKHLLELRQNTLPL